MDWKTSTSVFIIAEACENHLGDLSVAKDMCRLSKLAGADAVKFQHHLPDEEMLNTGKMSDNFDEHLYDFLNRCSLSIEEHSELKAYCEEIGIVYMCTPFSYKAAVELDRIGVSLFKIGSGELTDIPTLLRIASLGKPMILSTGMSTFDEIDRTVHALDRHGADFSLLNCTSEYPPVYEDINLGVIPKMIDRYKGRVIGHSDHTPDLYTCFAAVAMGARIIEKHVIIDKLQKGPDQLVSINFTELESLVSGIRKIEAAMGSEKRVNAKEEAVREWAFRSVVTVRDIKRGEEISQEMIWSKRPGTGIPSWKMDEVIGKKAKIDIDKDVMISWDDLI